MFTKCSVTVLTIHLYCWFAGTIWTRSVDRSCCDWQHVPGKLL